jgi:hypothetical protein
MDVHDYLERIKGATLASFALNSQLVELVFSHPESEKIRFSVDCRINTSDKEVLQQKVFFDRIDEVASQLVLLVKANLKKVVEVKTHNAKLYLTFSNGYDLIFHLYDEYDAPLSILFYEKSPGAYTSLNFSNDDVTVEKVGF